MSTSVHNSVVLSYDAERISLLKELAQNLTDITLNGRQMCDLELLATGALSPLQGFMTQADYESVLDRMRLQNQTLWPIPVCLNIHRYQAENMEAGQSIALRDGEGFLLAIMHIDDIWPIEWEKEASAVYQTTNPSHPGVAYLMGIADQYYIGGRLEVISLPLHFDFQQIRLAPEEVRSIYKKLGWNRIVGFFTRNPIHRPQFELTLKAMRQADANLLILPTAGITLQGDFDHYTRIRCYREVTKQYPPDSYLLNLLPLAQRMAGPREALLHCLIAKNYGCTHFIIGHHHASPNSSDNKQSHYGPFAAQEIAENLSEEIGIEIISFSEMVYLPFEDEYRPADQVTEGTQTVSFSGLNIWNRLRTGRKIPMWATFPEVVRELRKSYPPPKKQGMTIFFTGLSGAGKSTLAKILYSRFLEIGDRPVTLLDGDIVRQNLSRELNFSKEHRDINVKRIGFVASEITKNRGIAICAPIAPYESTRRGIREQIERYGGFIEVHVATPLDVCEKRDRKGMYAKARAGMIKGFTGVDDPYEVPKNPELRIDTSSLMPNDAVKRVLVYLSEKNYI